MNPHRYVQELPNNEYNYVKNSAIKTFPEPRMIHT